MEFVAFFVDQAIPLSDKKSASKNTGKAKAVLKKTIADYNLEHQAQEGHASLAQFAKCRPLHNWKMACTPLNQCLYEYCANCSLKINTIKRIVGLHSRLPHMFHAVHLSICPWVWKSLCLQRVQPVWHRQPLATSVSSWEPHWSTSWHRWTSKKVFCANK